MRHARLVALAAATLAVAGAAVAEQVQLINGTVIRGKLIVETSRYIELRTGPRQTTKIDKAIVYKRFPDGARVPEIPDDARVGRTAPPKPKWPEPFGTIPVEREKALRARVEAMAAAETAAERAKVRAAALLADQLLLPSLATVEQWLASPRKYPKAEGRPHAFDLPWKGENPRAVAVLGVPSDYDPVKQPWPLVIALHGTEDKPDAMVSRMRPLIKAGCLLLAPRTVNKRRFWHQDAELANLLRIVGHLADHYRIDPRRILLCGGSGGGMGTWGIAAKHPELFCAAASSAGMPAVPPSAVTRLRHVPFFIMHGRKDHIPVSGVRAMVEAMKKHNIPHVYFEHDGGHFPTEAQYQKMRDWIQKAPSKTDASRRPALLRFIGEAAAAKPLKKPSAKPGDDELLL